MVALNLLLIINQSESAPQAFRRDPGHPQWHHGAFHDVRDTIRSEVRRLLHTRAEVSLSFFFFLFFFASVPFIFSLRF